MNKYGKMIMVLLVEIYDTDTTEAVAVKVNNSYHIAKRQ